MAVTFALPELGENIESGVVTKVLVSVGDAVSVDQPVIELETDKAVVEVPCSVAGTVEAVGPAEGDTIFVGDMVVVVANGAAEEVPEGTEAEAVDASSPEERREADAAQEAEALPRAEEDEAAAPAQRDHAVAASPSIRRFAREIGVDIEAIAPSAASGRLSLEDVKAYARNVNTRSAGHVPAPGTSPGAPLPDFSRWGEVERQAMSGVRQRTAERMAASWTTIPHVTHDDRADITEIERLRKQYGPLVAEKGAKLTTTAILIKILATALKKFPQFNSSVDMEKRELILKRYYNIGVAVDTDRGLLVPVVKGVDGLNITEIAVELSRLAERAREHKSTLDELQGGTFTLTNLGGIGGTRFSPIINAPEVAVLGVSRASVTGVFEGSEFVPKLLLPLSLSYDHRVIDGADAARFLRWVCLALETPFMIELEG